MNLSMSMGGMEAARVQQYFRKSRWWYCPWCKRWWRSTSDASREYLGRKPYSRKAFPTNYCPACPDLRIG